MGSKICRAPIRIVDETNFEMITNRRQPTLISRVFSWLLLLLLQPYSFLYVVTHIAVEAYIAFVLTLYGMDARVYVCAGIKPSF